MADGADGSSSSNATDDSVRLSLVHTNAWIFYSYSAFLMMLLILAFIKPSSAADDDTATSAAVSEGGTSPRADRVRATLGQFKPRLIRRYLCCGSKIDAGFIMRCSKWACMVYEFVQFSSFAFRPSYGWWNYRDAACKVDADSLMDNWCAFTQNPLAFSILVLSLAPDIIPSARVKIFCIYALAASLLVYFLLALYSYGVRWLCRHCLIVITGGAMGRHSTRAAALDDMDAEGDIELAENPVGRVPSVPFFGVARLPSLDLPAAASGHDDDSTSQLTRGHGTQEVESRVNKGDLVRNFYMAMEPNLNWFVFDLGLIPIMRLCLSVAACERPPGEELQPQQYIKGSCSNATECQELPPDSELRCWTHNHSALTAFTVLLLFAMCYTLLNYLIFTARDRFLGIEGRYALLMTICKMSLCFFNTVFEELNGLTLVVFFVCIFILLLFNVVWQPCIDVTESGIYANSLRTAVMSGCFVSAVCAAVMVVSMWLGDESAPRLEMTIMFIPLALCVMTVAYVANKPHAKRYFEKRKEKLLGDAKEFICLPETKRKGARVFYQYSALLHKLFHTQKDELLDEFAREQHPFLHIAALFDLQKHSDVQSFENISSLLQKLFRNLYDPLEDLTKDQKRSDNEEVKLALSVDAVGLNLEQFQSDEKQLKAFALVLQAEEPAQTVIQQVNSIPRVEFCQLYFECGSEENDSMLHLDLNSHALGSVGANIIRGPLCRTESVHILELESCALDGEECALPIATILSHNCSITKLYLAGNRLGADGAAALAEGLRRNEHIEVLNVTRNQLGNEGAIEICGALSLTNTCISELYIAENKVTALGGKSVADMLEENCTLTLLDASGNKFGQESSQLLAVNLKTNTTMKELIIGGDTFGKFICNAASISVESIRRDDTPAVLDFSETPLRLEGAVILAVLLTSCNSCTSLNMSRNRLSGDGCQAFAALLETNTSLTQMSINDNGLDKDRAAKKALGMALMSNAGSQLSTIRCDEWRLDVEVDGKVDLDLSEQKLVKEDGTFLAGALKINSTVSSLNISQNNFEGHGDPLGKALSLNATMTRLEAANSALGGHSFGLHLATALRFHGTKLTDVNVAGNAITPEGGQAIARALQDNVTLVNFNISGNHLGHEAGAEMGTVLTTHNTTLLHLSVGGKFQSGIFGPFLGDCASLNITKFREDAVGNELNFDNNLLHTDGAMIVTRLIRTSKLCTVLRMNGNYLNSHVGTALGQTLLTGVLIELHVSNNSLGAEGVAALADALKHNETLTLLNLKRNMIRSAGAEHLADMFVTNSTLLDVDLSNNEVGCFSVGNDGVAPFKETPQGAGALARGLSENATITRLNVMSNGIAVAEGTLLFSAVASTPSFVALDVLPVLSIKENAIRVLSLKGSFGSKLEDGGTAFLAKLLATNTSVTMVDLSFNCISPQGLAALGDGLQSNQTLVSLNMNNNDIGLDEGKLLAQFVLGNTTVSRLELNSNKLRIKGGQALAAALKKDSALAELHLNNNSLGLEGGAAMEAALKINTAVKQLHVWGNRIRHDVLHAVMNQSPDFALFGGATALDLSDVRFDDDGTDAAVLLELLHANHTLTKLDETSKERLSKFKDRMKSAHVTLLERL